MVSYDLDTSGKLKGNKTTFLHLAAFERFNAVKVIAGTLEKASHVIALLFASAPTYVVERNGNIFIVTVFITVGVILWMAALSSGNVIQVCRWSLVQLQAVQVVSIWTQCPFIIIIIAEKQWKLFNLSNK